MTARFEICRTDAEQPWHARLIVNGRKTWRVENLTRQVGAERAILSLMHATTGRAWKLRWNVRGEEKVLVHLGTDHVHQLHVHYFDERTS